LSRFFETCEARTLFSAPGIALSGGTLTIQGTEKADVIMVGWTQDGAAVQVVVATPDGTTTKTLPAAKLKQAVIDAKAGDDVVVIGEAFGPFVACKIDGGAGNDVIMGGAGDDRISGGDGNDVVLAGAGEDRLAGDKGDDVLLGGDGDDRLDGGKGANFLFGDGGADRIRSKSVQDMISAAEEDVVKLRKGGAVLI
jgi:Ca2+-binding RTX toxin-like protein